MLGVVVQRIRDLLEVYSAFGALNCGPNITLERQQKGNGDGKKREAQKRLQQKPFGASRWLWCRIAWLGSGVWVFGHDA